MTKTISHAQSETTTFGMNIVGIRTGWRICPHCGSWVPYSPEFWDFTLSHGLPHGCSACLQNMHAIELDLSQLSETELAIYQLIEDKGPIMSQDIADYLGMATDYVRRLLQLDSKIRAFGVDNQRCKGYFIRKQLNA